MSRRLGRLAVLTLIVPLLAGCAAPEVARETAATVTATATGTPADFPRTVTDASQRTLTLPAAPGRIVSLSAGATETLFALGAGPRVVAVDLYSDTPEAARALPKIDFSRPSPEQVVAFKPDLLVMTGRQRDQVQHFRDLGVPVLYVGEPGSLEAVLEHILLIAHATGDDARGAALVASMRARIEAVERTVGDAPSHPRVFYELTPALHTAGPTSFIGSMLSTLRLENVATGPTPFLQLTSEALIARDPEVVLLAEVGASKVTPVSVAARPGWARVTAVRAGRVHAIDTDRANRPGPRVVDALEEIARLCYPERFR
ncbi:MAG: ABC transporter substrate-binding protein [Dehalococcoidia bacterium]